MDNSKQYSFTDLLEIMQFLRSDQGCPWDRAQSHQSVRGNLLEEAYEVVDAITEQDDDNLQEELGDLLLQVVFHTQMAADRGAFQMDQVVDRLCHKLISRHSHLFGQDQATTESEVLATWEKNKLKEQKIQSLSQSLTKVPKSFTALQRSQKLQKRAAQWNFDWSDPEPVYAKVEEELAEFRAAMDQADQDHLLEEAGDVLMAFANLLRHLKIDAELALHLANQKFQRRLTRMDELMQADGLPAGPFETGVAEAYYQKAKAEDQACSASKQTPEE